MLTSPISLVIGSNTHSFKRINQDNFGSVYLSKEITDVEARLTIRHAYEKATPLGTFERHNVDLQYSVFDADGKATLYQAYAVVRNLRGSDVAIAGDQIDALALFLAANDATLIDWES